MAPAVDPYIALGVARGATDKEIKAAHRRLAKRFHPDAAQGDTVRFLLVQEAYRVLSDPLQRREWDARHAPGPMRADQADAPRARAPRRPARPAKPAATDASAGDGAGTPPAGTSRGTAQPAPGPGRPRSPRSYTWSAAEVPWWEEGTSDNKRQPGRRRPARGRAVPPSPAPAAGPASTGQAPDGSPEVPVDPPSPFDVYNRSSGAAWSMAARAYFRRGDQDLPRRGTFQYQGTQVVTGARARTAAEAETRARARTQANADAHRRTAESALRSDEAAPASPGADAPYTAPAYTYASAGVARDAQRIHQVREQVRRRLSAQTWPTLRGRLLYALLAWVPLAILIGYGGSAATGCDRASLACPSNLETGQAIGIALSLGLLVALPKVAYVGALASAASLFVGLVVVGLMAFSGVRPPLSVQETALIGAALALSYLAAAVIAVLHAPRARPWQSGTPRSDRVRVDRDR